ncbi:uncharacterized protein LOC102805599 [Saccoglossus kowalevskii]
MPAGLREASFRKMERVADLSWIEGGCPDIVNIALSVVTALQVETLPEVQGVVDRTLTLQCRFPEASEHSLRRLVQWYKTREGDTHMEHVLSMVDREDAEVYGTYAGRAGPARGDGMLGEQGDIEITRLELADEGVYTCEVNYYVAKEEGLGNTKVYISKIVDQVSIFGLGEGPEGEQVVKYFPPDEPQTLICRASRAKPVAKLRWYKDDEELMETVETYEESSDGSFNTINTLQFTPRKSDNGAILKCESYQEPEIELKKSASVIISTYTSQYMGRGFYFNYLCTYIV